MASAALLPSASDRTRLATAVLFAAGAALGSPVPAIRAAALPVGALVAVLAAAAAVAGSPAARRRRTGAGAAIAALACGLGAAAAHRAADPLPGLLRLWERHGVAVGDGTVHLRARVLETGRLADGRAELVVRIDALRPAGGCTVWAPGRRRVRARLTAPPEGGAPAWRPGDLLEATARLHLPRSYRNPGGFDYPAYLNARGIRLTGSIKSARLVRSLPHRRRPLRDVAPGTRRLLVERLARAAGPERAAAGAFLAALLLGERQAIDRDLERTLQRAGVYHIVALSGLNVGLVGLLSAGTARAAGAAPVLARTAAVLGIAAYWLVARGGGSIARAALMGLLYLAGGLLGRRVRPLGTVAISGIAIVASEPAWLADPGFQLSYAATVAILLAAAPGDRRRRRAIPVVGGIWRGALAAWRVSWAAWLGTALVSARHFQALAPAALPANLVAVPVAAALLVLALGIAAVEPLWPRAAAAGTAAAALLVAALERVSAGCAAVPFLSFRVVPPPGALVLAGTAALLPAARGRAWRRAVTAASIVLLAWVAAAGRPGRPAGRLEVVTLDVGQGDAILVRLPEGPSLLVDAGPVTRSGFDVGERVVAPAVRALGVLRIDLLVITHAHRDHLGGARGALDELAPRAVWLGRTPAGDPAVRALEAAAARRGIAVVRPRRGVTLSLGGARLEVLNPGPDPAGGPNDDSLVLRIARGGEAVLLTGDIEARSEAALAGSGLPLRAGLLKVAHHGSRTSSSAPFLRRVGAHLAVISVGADNAWGHPDPAVLERLGAAGSEVRRTDRDGALRFSTTGETPWEVERLAGALTGPPPRTPSGDGR